MKVHLRQVWSRKPGRPRPLPVPCARYGCQRKQAEPFWRSPAARSVRSLIWRGAEFQMNPSTNSFHFLFCPVGTAQKLSSEKPFPTGKGHEESCITNDIKKQSQLSPLKCQQRLSRTKSVWRACPHFTFPSEPQFSLTPPQTHTPIMARCTLVIISPNLWWRPVFFDSCQIPLIMSLQLVHSQTHLRVGGLFSTMPS